MHISIMKVTLQVTKVCKSSSSLNIFAVKHAIIYFLGLFEFNNFMNFILSIIKFIKFKPIIKFKKFERHKRALHLRLDGREFDSRPPPLYQDR